MLSGFRAFTITHNEVKAGNLAHFVLDKSVQGSTLNNLKKDCGIDELLYLSTCNRVLFLIYMDPLKPLNKEAFFKSFNPNIDKDLLVRVKAFKGQDSIKHLFRVAASLDSMVVGEREIFRQLRESYTESKENGLSGDNIRLAMRFCVESSKAIYAQTKIGEKKVSVVSLAVEQFNKYNINPDSNIVLVGAGQTIELVSKFLTKLKYHNILVFNRNPEKAEEIANRFSNGSGHSLIELESFDKPFDAMFVCTGSVDPIIKREHFRKENFKTGSKCIIDLSIPFNVEKLVSDFEHVDLISVEELQEMAKNNMSFRQNEISSAMHIIVERMEEFKKIFQQRMIERAMGDVPVEIKKIKEHAIKEVFQKEIADMDDGTKAIFLKAMNYMEKKCIGIPMKAAKNIIK